MSTVWLSVAYCWRQWQVKAWPDEAAARAHRDELVAEGLQSGLDGFAALPIEVSSPLPGAWPVAPASLFAAAEPSPLEMELARKLPYVVSAAEEIMNADIT